MRVIKNIVGILARNIQMYNVCHRSLSILHVWLAGKWRLLYENPWQFMLTDLVSESVGVDEWFVAKYEYVCALSDERWVSVEVYLPQWVPLLCLFLDICNTEKNK